MTLIKYLFALLVVFNAYAQKKQTVVVFIDLNNSYNEVEAARKAAAIRGEKLFVFPTTDAEKPYKKEQFRKSLQLLSDQNLEISSLVVSGHHTYYSGYYGENHTNVLYPDDIASELSKFPKLRNSIRSFFGAGCHSLTKPQAQRWIDYFKNLEVCGGYMDIGPGNQAAAAGQNIFDFLVKEDQVAKINSVSKLYDTGVFTYGSMTALATVAINKESGATYCSIEGSKEQMFSCPIREDLLSSKFTILKAAILGTYVQETSLIKENIGSLKDSQSFEEIAPGLFKVTSKMDVDDIYNETIQLRNDLEMNCPESKLLEHLSNNDIYTLRDTAAVIKNHQLYFSESIKELEKLGIPYPKEGASLFEYQTFFNESMNTLDSQMKSSKDLARELRDSWGGFWNAVSSDHQSKVKKADQAFTKAEALKGVVAFMKKQVVDRECLTSGWTQDYQGKKSSTLISEMTNNPNYCDQ